MTIKTINKNNKMPKKHKTDFVNNYRFLDLEPDDIKNLMNLNPKDFANKLEKKIFHYFNISNYFIIKKNEKEETVKSMHYFFSKYEKAEEYKEKNIAYEDFEIKQKFVLLMNR